MKRFHHIALPLMTLALVACGGQKPAADAGATPPPAGDTGAAPTDPKPEPKPEPDAPKSGALKIVSSLPRTGSANAQTTTIVNGIKMAVDETGGNIKGSAGDFAITYEDWDDASAKKGDWDPEVEAGNADKAVGDKDVVAYIGTYNSGAAMISMPVLNKAGLLMVSPANTYPALTKPGTGEAHEPDAYRPSGKIMVPDGCFEEAFIQACGAENANERVYVTFGGVPPEKLTGTGAEFVKAYRAKFGAEPEAYAVYGYMAAKVAIDAIKAAGSKDRNAISAAAAKVSYEDSALGKFSFTEHGDTTMATMSGNIIKGGKFEFVSILTMD